MKLKDGCSLEKNYDLDSILKSRDITLPTKYASQSYDFPSSHIWMWELDYEEGWSPVNWCFWTVVLEKTLESPLDCKEIKSVHSKGNQSWILIERLMKLKLQYSGHLMWRTDSLEKTLMLGKTEGGRRGWKDEMVGWHHWLNGHEYEQQTVGTQSPVWYSPWSHKESTRHNLRD